MQLDRPSMTSWQWRFKLPPEPEQAKHLHGRLQVLLRGFGMRRAASPPCAGDDMGWCMMAAGSARNAERTSRPP